MCIDKVQMYRFEAKINAKDSTTKLFESVDVAYANNKLD